MPSSELLRCTVCGQEFETVDSLREHQRAEKEEEELRNKGFADG
jgi:transcription initiation factor IIE alpha subunit